MLEVLREMFDLLRSGSEEIVFRRGGWFFAEGSFLWQLLGGFLL